MYILHKKLSRGQEVEYAIIPPPPKMNPTTAYRYKNNCRARGWI